jgi:hypothetical protein
MMFRRKAASLSLFSALTCVAAGRCDQPLAGKDSLRWRMFALVPRPYIRRAGLGRGTMLFISSRRRLSTLTQGQSGLRDAAVSRPQVKSPVAVAFAGSRAGHVTFFAR